MINKNFHIFFFIFLNIILFSILVYGGSRNDYALYEVTWKAILNNEEDVRFNTYGPLHLFISFIYEINSLLPKIIFGVLFCILQFYLFFKILKKSHNLLFYFYLFLPCNFLIITNAYFYGINDTVVAFFLIISVTLFINKKYLTSGVFFSISAFTKLYPLLLLPIFALYKKINLKFLYSFIISTSLILLISFYKFNSDLIFEPLKFGSLRAPNFISILASLKYDFPDSTVVLFLIKYNSILVISLSLITLIYCLMKKKCLLTSIMLIFLVVLTTYKVGHTQFYIPLCVIFSILLNYNSLYIKHVKTVLPLVFLLSVTSVAYPLTGGFDIMKQENIFWSIRENIGYLYFITNILIIYKISKINTDKKQHEIEF
tara:strand:- start:1173 stop:2288 length:1116 start_codon:yes stop_codon:yes gene_type:complete